MIPAAVLHGVVVERWVVSAPAEVRVLPAYAVGHIVGLADVEPSRVVQALDHVEVHAPLGLGNVA